ncbi:MAG: hypothetical protein QOI31_3036 [Solirubrobacterales bacterium]|jgi:hypothetical protein|nr:hypothetical protein [Solirubrobacterales bacterium]
MRKLPLVLAALIVVAVLVPAQAQAFKPDIVYVRATDESEGITFSVKVRMDKGGRNQRKVSVTFEGDRKEAEPLERPPLSYYETNPYSAPVRNCYRVKVVAHNRFGTTTKNMRAGMIGTNGC